MFISHVKTDNESVAKHKQIGLSLCMTKFKLFNV